MRWLNPKQHTTDITGPEMKLEFILTQSREYPSHPHLIASNNPTLQKRKLWNSVFQCLSLAAQQVKVQTDSRISVTWKQRLLQSSPCRFYSASSYFIPKFFLFVPCHGVPAQKTKRKYPKSGGHTDLSMSAQLSGHLSWFRDSRVKIPTCLEASNSNSSKQ